jgi:hypothetical protein
MAVTDSDSGRPYRVCISNIQFLAADDTVVDVPIPAP